LSTTQTEWVPPDIVERLSNDVQVDHKKIVNRFKPF
jgi:hypothetical protein